MSEKIKSPAAGLLPFEQANFHLEYQKYFQMKRENFFRAITEFRDLWECFQELNDLWTRAISDLEHLNEPTQMLPSLLFRYAHARLLIAMELGFSCCIGDAYGCIRGGIEAVAQAYKIHREPQLAIVWTARDNGKAEHEHYKRAFEYNKKVSLFPSACGLDRLYNYWKWASDLGPHANVVAVGKSFEQVSSEGKQRWVLHHFETNSRKLATFLFALLRASSEMEQAFYRCFETRLQLDPELRDRRQRFREKTEQQRYCLRTKYNLTADTSTSELNAELREGRTSRAPVEEPRF